MSLFGAILKQGAKYADNLLDDAAVQAKDRKRKPDAPDFNEEEWLKENPRPFPELRPKEMTPEQKAEYRRWQFKKQRDKNRNALREYQRERRKKIYAEDPEFREKVRKQNAALSQDEEFRKKRAKAARESYRRKSEREKRELADRQRERYQNSSEERLRAKVKAAARRAARLERTPASADHDAIKEIYRQAAALTEATGEPHHVDHIIPLQGDNVSGFHHQDNLLIVPAPNNLRKGNLFDPETYTPVPPRKRR